LCALVLLWGSCGWGAPLADDDDEPDIAAAVVNSATPDVDVAAQEFEATAIVAHAPDQAWDTPAAGTISPPAGRRSSTLPRLALCRSNR
jgi:hypothetical protein